MPTSFHDQISPILWFFESRKPQSVLDVGCGWGKYGVLLREYIPSITKLDALEVFPKYISDLHRSVYDQILIGDVRTMEIEPYDVFLLVDVIEHMTLEEGVELCHKLKGQKLVATPKDWNPQGAEYGNDHERHLSHWTRELFAGNFKGCEINETGNSWLVAIP